MPWLLIAQVALSILGGIFSFFISTVKTVVKVGVSCAKVAGKGAYKLYKLGKAKDQENIEATNRQIQSTEHSKNMNIFK